MPVPSNGSSSMSASGSTIDSTGTWTWRSSGLRTPVSTTVQVRFGPTRKRPTSSSGFCVALRPIRCTSRPAASAEPLERERQVRAALGLRDGVDLVDDHLLDAVEDLRGLAGQHQVQRLGRGDEDVRRVADHVAPVLLRRVAGAQADLDVGADPAQRRAQVLLDVVGERLQRRHVDEPRAVGARLGDEAVERPQEGGQRLARAGGRRDQRVLAGRDRRPGQRLGRRGLRERPLEPLPHLRRER